MAREAAASAALDAAVTAEAVSAAEQELGDATKKRKITEATRDDQASGARTATVRGKKVTVSKAAWEGRAAPTPLEREAMDQISTDSSRGGEDGVHQGTEGGTGSGYLGAGKNAKVTLKHVVRERKGLNLGFTHVRCSQGAGKPCGRCVHIEEWDGLAIPDLRLGAAPDAWVAVLRSHMRRQRVGDRVKPLHKGGLLPWEGDAATGRSLNAAKEVEYLTERQAAAIVKEHNSSYKEWLKKNPSNN